MANKNIVGSVNNSIKNFIDKTKYLVLVMFALAFAYLIFIQPMNQVAGLRGELSTLQVIELENKLRATYAQIAGGIGLLFGLYLTWKRIDVAREGQITERFTHAINQLGNSEIEIKLGGIYALERIANESEIDYWPIMEILTSYIRNGSMSQKKNGTDI